jgi:hypothetical protein
MSAVEHDAACADERDAYRDYSHLSSPLLSFGQPACANFSKDHVTFWPAGECQTMEPTNIDEIHAPSFSIKKRVLGTRAGNLRSFAGDFSYFE